MNRSNQDRSGRRILRQRVARTMAPVGAVLAYLLVATAIAQDVVLPDGYVAETVVSGLSAPVDLAYARDGRIFFAEKAGIVRVAQDGVLRPEPFLDLTAEVNYFGDRGMVGIALHPRFPERPHVYLSYTYDPPEVQAMSGDAGPNGAGTRVSRLIRVDADPAFGHDRALPGSEVVLLGTNSTFAFMGDAATRNPEIPSCGPVGAYVRDCLPADEHSHTIGRVRFGPDGALWVASGDGADYHGTQPYHVRTLHLDSLAGKLLRIDPDTGDGLPDNPFFDGDPQSNRSKVVAYGLRNPYSFTFHPETWEPVMGDVGWAMWEMINVGAGNNFGWPCYEGGNGENLEQPSFREWPECQELYAGAHGPVAPPAYGYDRRGTGGAIIAGEFYLAPTAPDRYAGGLFIADYYQGWIRLVYPGSAGRPGTSHDFATVPFPVAVSIGPDGHAAYVNVWGGTLTRLRNTRAAAEPAAPVAIARVEPRSGPAPHVVRVDASRSYDPAGGPLRFEWSFGPGLSSPLAETEWFFFRGDHDVTLTVTNQDGVSTSTTVTVRSADPAPRARIEAPAPGTSYAIGDTVGYRGSGVAADGSAIPEERLRWQLFVHHDDRVDPAGLPPRATGTGGTIFAADRGERALELCLTVVDDDGMEDVTCTELLPR